MQYSKLLSATTITSLIALTGCGGGGGGGSSEPELPVISTFTLTANAYNECGQAQIFNDYTVFIQDANWQILNTLTPNAQGLVTIDTESTRLNYTLVANTLDEQGNKSLDIVSYSDVTSSNNAVYTVPSTTTTNETCTCITQQVDLQHFPVDVVYADDSTSDESNWAANNQRLTRFNDVEVCNLTDNTALHSFMVLATNNASDLVSYSAFITDFTATQTGIWSATATDEAARGITESNENSRYQYGQLLNDVPHFVVNKTDESLTDEALIYDNHTYISNPDESVTVEHFAKATQVFENTETFLVTRVSESFHSLVSNDYNDALSVSASMTPPNIDLNSLPEIANDQSYDFSAVGNFPLTQISFSYAIEPTSGLDLPFTWTQYGPITGTLAMTPDLPGYENLIDDITNVETIELMFLSNGSSNSYSGYIDNFIQSGLTSSFYNEQQGYYLLLE